MCQPSKLETRVRIPLAAPTFGELMYEITIKREDIPDPPNSKTYTMADGQNYTIYHRTWWTWRMNKYFYQLICPNCNTHNFVELNTTKECKSCSVEITAVPEKE